MRAFDDETDRPTPITSRRFPQHQPQTPTAGEPQ